MIQKKPLSLKVWSQTPNDKEFFDLMKLKI